MFDFNIEEFKEGLTGMSINDKLGAIKEKHEELEIIGQLVEMALNQVEDLKYDILNEHEKYVWNDIAKDAERLIQDNPNLTIDNLNKKFIIEAFHGKVFVSAEIFDDVFWYITIKMELVANTEKYHETLSSIATKLKYFYDPYLFEIHKTVKENKIKDTMLSIITKLCNNNNEEKIL